MANFAEDSKIANWLTMRGVQFEYREGVRYSELSTNWNLVNHGRHDGHPVDKALIEKYASAMDQGAIFPAPIIAKNSDGHEVLDGCQRLSSAHLLGQTIFNAYIIKSSSPAIRASVRICANSVLNGTAPSQEWTIGKIVDILYEQHRFSPIDCSQWSGQPVKRIEEEIAARDSVRWMTANGIDTTMKPANQKGFQVVFWEQTDANIRDKAPKELKRIVANIQQCKANNAEAEHMLAETLAVKPKKGVDIRTQLTSKTKEVFEDRAEIRARMNDDTPRSQHPIDNANRALMAALTSIRACAKEHLHADEAQAARMIDLLIETLALSKKIVPTEFWRAPNDILGTTGVLQTR